MKTAKIIAAAVIISATFSSLSLLAQSGPPPGPGTGAPIDGGVVALVLGAAALGYKKMREKKD